MSIFDNFNNRFGQFGMPANLGLLTTGIGLLDGQNPLQAIQAGIGTYGSFQDMEEDRRRKAALLQLSEQYGDDPRIQQLINANPEAAVSLIANLEMQKRKPTAKFRNLTSDELVARGFPKGTVAQINDTSGQVNVLANPLRKTKPNTAKAADGYLYFTDGENQGQRVFPDVVKTPTLSNLKEKANLLADAGINPGSVQYNKAMFGITPEKDSTFVEKQKALIDAGIQEGSPQYLQALFNISPEKQSAFAEKQQALISSGFTEGTDEYNQALFGIKDQPLSAFQEKRKALIDDGISEGSTQWNKALYGITPKDPKSASLVNLISDNDITVGGITYKAGQRFSLDQNTQQDLIVEAAGQGAIKAPQKIEEVKAPTVDTSKVDAVVKELEDTTSNTSLNVDVGTAAGGDIPGVVTDLANTVFGAFTGTFSPNRADQVALINEANNTIKVPLVKALNRAGSKFAIEQVDSILPLPNNTNQTFMSRFEALKPRLDIAIKQLAAESVDTEKSEGERIIAKEEARQLINYKANMERAIAVYRKNTGGSKTAAQTAADKILGVD